METPGVYFCRDFQRPWNGAGYGLNFRERGEIRGVVLKAAKMDCREEQTVSYNDHEVAFTVMSPWWITIHMLRCKRSRIFTVTLDHGYCGLECRHTRARK